MIKKHLIQHKNIILIQHVNVCVNFQQLLKSTKQKASQVSQNIVSGITKAKNAS